MFFCICFGLSLSIADYHGHAHAKQMNAKRFTETVEGPKYLKIRCMCLLWLANDIKSRRPKLFITVDLSLGPCESSCDTLRDKSHINLVIKYSTNLEARLYVHAPRTASSDDVIQ